MDLLTTDEAKIKFAGSDGELNDHSSDAPLYANDICVGVTETTNDN